MALIDRLGLNQLGRGIVRPGDGVSTFRLAQLLFSSA